MSFMYESHIGTRFVPVENHIGTIYVVPIWFSARDGGAENKIEHNLLNF